VGPRAGLDGWKISSPPGFDPGTSSPWSVAIPTELPVPHSYTIISVFNLLTPNVNYSGRTASLTSKVAFYIFIQQI